MMTCIKEDGPRTGHAGLGRVTMTGGMFGVVR